MSSAHCGVECGVLEDSIESVRVDLNQGSIGSRANAAHLGQDLHVEMNHIFQEEPKAFRRRNNAEMHTIFWDDVSEDGEHFIRPCSENFDQNLDCASQQVGCRSQPFQEETFHASCSSIHPSSQGAAAPAHRRRRTFASVRSTGSKVPIKRFCKKLWSKIIRRNRFRVASVNFY